MKLLSEKEIADHNRIITQVENLIKMRGHHDANSGVYEGGSFFAAWDWSARGVFVQLYHRRKEVLSVQWAPGNPMSSYLEPGAWQAEFMALQTAHA